MKDISFTTLMDHPLVSKPLRALLYSLGLPRTAAEKKVFSDVAQAHNEAYAQLDDWTAIHRLDDLYLQTNALTSDAKVMSKLFFARYFLTVELTDLTSGSTPNAKNNGAAGNALYDTYRDTNKCDKQSRDLRLLTLQVAVKRIEAALRECAKNK